VAADILLIDDHPMVRTALRSILTTQDDWRVCAEASSLQEAMDAVKAHEPQIALVDLQLQNGNGIEIVQELKRQNSKIRMLVVSMHDENLYAERALRAGAHGYICKTESSQTLIAAIRRVLDGKHYVSDSMNERILANSSTDNDKFPETRIELLSDRELQTFELIGDGLTAREIAERLGVAVKTVNTFRENIKSKLKIDSANRLTRVAIEWKLTGAFSN
jgi:DNA-binding NarL/FixJ family response regulator